MDPGSCRALPPRFCIADSPKARYLEPDEPRRPRRPAHRTTCCWNQMTNISGSRSLPRPRPDQPRPRTHDSGRLFARTQAFNGVEILTGNIGYLNLTAFWRVDEARATITDAMRVLRRADALILDLRDNRGGSPETASPHSRVPVRSAGAAPLSNCAAIAGIRWRTPHPRPPWRNATDTGPCTHTDVVQNVLGGRGFRVHRAGTRAGRGYRRTDSWCRQSRSPLSSQSARSRSPSQTGWFGPPSKAATGRVGASYRTSRSPRPMR